MICAIKTHSWCIKDPAEDSQHLVSWLKTHPKHLKIGAYKNANTCHFLQRTTEPHLYVSYQPLLCDKV